MLSFLQDSDSAWIDRIVHIAEAWAPRAVAALVVLLVGCWVAKALANLVRRLLTARRVDATLVAFLCSLLFIILTTLVIISSLGQLGVNTTSFVAIMGAATLALGFALQDTLSHFASGVMLILFKPFKVGDFVETGGGTGVVEEIGIFVTTMRTADNKTIIIPNGSITGGTITNYSTKDTRRVDCVFGIG